MTTLAKPLRYKDRTNVFGYLVALDAGFGHHLFLTQLGEDPINDVDWRDDQREACIYFDYDVAVAAAAAKDPQWAFRPRIVELIGRVV